MMRNRQFPVLFVMLITATSFAQKPQSISPNHAKLPAEAIRDPQFKDDVANFHKLSRKLQTRRLKEIDGMLEAKNAFLGHPTPADSQQAQASAKTITNSALYKKAGPKESPNWIYNGLEKIKKLFDRDPELPRPIAGPSLGFLPFLFWGLIGLVALTILGIGIYFASKIRRAKRGTKKLLDDTEDASTFDEWLAAAKRYAAEGNFRRAIRCAYISGLLQFDGARIARFDRGQTNWQHLSRIESSQKLPAGIKYREETSLFDRVWYGGQTATSEQFEFLLSRVLNLKSQLESPSRGQRGAIVGQNVNDEGVA